MAKFNYAKSRNTASRLIEKFGQRGAIQRYTAGSGRPTYPETPCDLVVLDYRTDQIDGTRITSKDRIIYISMKGIDFELAKEDRIRDGTGTVYEIIPPLKPLNPGGTTVYVEVQGRA